MSVGAPVRTEVGLLTVSVRTCRHFVVHFLTNEGVDIRFSPERGRHTSLVLLASSHLTSSQFLLPDNCADTALEIDDVWQPRQ